MSFSLAKNLFAERTILTLDVMERRCLTSGDMTGAYMAYSAKTIATFANKLLFRTRSRWLLTGEPRLIASQQLYEIFQEFETWRKRNNEYYFTLLQLQPERVTSLLSIPRGSTNWGFFDANFSTDIADWTLPAVRI